MRNMAEAKRATTADELLHMPDDGFRYELVRGELRRMSPAGYRHGLVAANLLGALRPHVLREGLGHVCAAETGFVLARDPDHVRAPDVAFVSRDRSAPVGDPPTGFWPGAPDLAAEVVSPSDSFTEVQAKAFDWLDAGTRLVLVVDPEQRTVTIYRSRDDVRVLTECDSIDGKDVVPGWSVGVAELFRHD
jgi:Uma2 family endonuclease